MMGLFRAILKNRVVNSNGYTRSDTGTKVHSYLRTHPKNTGWAKRLTKGVINNIKK